MGRHSKGLLTASTALASLLPLAFAITPALAGACGGAIAKDEPARDAGFFDAPVSTVTPPKDSGPPTPDAGLPEEDDPWMKGDPSPTSTAEVIELGPANPGQKVTFPIKDTALGFNVTGTMSDDDFAVKDIESPTGKLVHKDAISANGDHETSSTLFGQVASAGVPQSNHPSAMPALERGDWGVTFRAPGPVSATVRVQNTPDGQFHGGALDIHVYLPEGLDVEGDTVTKTHFKRVAGVRDRIDMFADAIRDLYQLTRGDVTFHLVSSKYVEIADSELAAAFSESKVAKTTQALNVVFSQASGSQEWWGIAGGVPGTPQPGTSQSAIALAMDDRADARMEGYVLAHEAGHFMGLSHTTEFQGGGFDPLEDTPQCPGMTFQNFTSCPDFTNIMAAAGATSGSSKASALQRRVVQGSPLYRAFLAGTAPPPKNALAPADFGKLFGHPGTPPTATEAWVIASLCGHAGHRREVRAALPSLSTRELGRIAADPAASPMVRRAAARLAAGR